jgi:hypothetical protein
MEYSHRSMSHQLPFWARFSEDPHCIDATIASPRRGIARSIEVGYDDSRSKQVTLFENMNASTLLTVSRPGVMLILRNETSSWTGVGIGPSCLMFEEDAGLE